jgi:ArsR family transcriptional regulator
LNKQKYLVESARRVIEAQTLFATNGASENQSREISVMRTAPYDSARHMVPGHIGTENWTDFELEQAARALKILSNPARIRLLCVLKAEERTVSELVVLMENLSQSGVSQHLSQLQSCGILSSRREANKVYYSIASPRYLTFIEQVQDIFCSDHVEVASDN